MKFNKIKLIAGLCLALGVSALGQNNVGTLVTDPIRPFSVSSTHPSAIANEIKGGPFSSSNLVGLSNIPAPRLEIGAIGYATNTGLYYRLTATNPATWSSINGANITNVSISNVTGTIAISNGGTGATNAAGARISLGLGWTALTNTNNATSLMGLVLDVGTTNNFLVTGAGDPSNFIIFTNPVILSGGAQGLRISDGTNEAWDFPSDAEAEFYYSFGFYGANASNNAAMTRTNLGLPLPALTNVSNSTFNTAIGLGTTNNVQFNTVRVAGTGSPTNLGVLLGASNGVWGSAGPPSVGVGINGTTRLFVSETAITASAPIGFDNTTNAATTRTNLGLGWSGLTNTNGAGLVAVNTNGEVVSPTNFWQVAPISTTVQYQTNVTGTSTNAATNSRNLFLFSLAPSVSGVTNTVTLPTNAATTFEGDRATVIHLATNSSNAVTAIRQLGAATNLITLNQVDEAVLLMYRGGQWRLADNLSFIEPIYFSGTNASANAAASRTNLGLGANAGVSFGSVSVGSTNDSLELISDETNSFFLYYRNNNVNASTLTFTPTQFIFDKPINFDNTTNAATTRTNLGLGATNNVEFNNITIADQTLTLSHGPEENVFVRNESGNLELEADSSIIAFSPVVASSTLTATSTVTAKTNLVVEGFVDFTSNHTNATPVTPNTPARWLQIRVGTNVFYLPAHQ